MSAAERASEASSAEQANELTVRANERTEERMAEYSTRRFHSHGYPMCAVQSPLASERQGLRLQMPKTLLCHSATKWVAWLLSPDVGLLVPVARRDFSAAIRGPWALTFGFDGHE